MANDWLRLGPQVPLKLTVCTALAAPVSLTLSRPVPAVLPVAGRTRVSTIVQLGAVVGGTVGDSTVPAWQVPAWNGLLGRPN